MQKKILLAILLLLLLVPAISAQQLLVKSIVIKDASGASRTGLGQEELETIEVTVKNISSTACAQTIVKLNIQNLDGTSVLAGGLEVSSAPVALSGNSETVPPISFAQGIGFSFAGILAPQNYKITAKAICDSTTHNQSVLVFSIFDRPQSTSVPELPEFFVFIVAVAVSLLLVFQKPASKRL